MSTTRVKKASATKSSKEHPPKKDGAAKDAAPKVGRFNSVVPNIRKRDGRVVPFDFDKIQGAILKAMSAAGEGSADEAAMVAHHVAADLVRTARKYKDFIPSVEGIQDEVEKQLMLADYVKTSKSYILYRAERAKRRDTEGEVPEHVKKLVAESKKYFRGNPLGEFVYLRTYARWIPEEGRRETWVETVQRYINFMRENLGDKLTDKEYEEVRQAILNQEVMPSMRAMQFAGTAASRCNVCVYNCSYVAPTKLEDFAEIMYLSMSGTGVGWAAESQNIQQLPIVAHQTGEKLKMHVVEDSKEGWCDSLTMGLKAWYGGKDIDFDYSQIRPMGARLKTMGGKASGPDPLRSLLGFARETILARQGKRITNMQAHDIMCKIGECVVAGGTRRSAMISLSDLDDEEIRDAKKGHFYITNPQRSMANNSAVYETKPTNEQFLKEWLALIESKSGERGIFNRAGVPFQIPKRRLEYFAKKYKREEGYVGQIGTNPCGEILLQSKQFCNLSEVIARSKDDEKKLIWKSKIAAILGTYQSTLTNFRYLSKEWKQNCEDERLLGVSITGQWDCPAVRNAKTLQKMRKEAVETNQKYAKRFGINASTAVTCVKPSGTVSKTFDNSSGMHPRFAPYYIQRIRISATDSLFRMLRDQGVPYHPEVGQSMENANTYVIEFPVVAPKSTVYKDDLTAIQQLEYWKMVKENFTEHNPSVTVSVGDNEWLDVAHWIYQNWDMVGGLSFLPRADHIYRLAPQEATTKERVEHLAKHFAHIDYSKIVTYEKKDETDVKKELACAGGTCEIEI